MDDDVCAIDHELELLISAPDHYGISARLPLCLTGKKPAPYIPRPWQRSSVVEQGNHNPLVGGSNPSAATTIYMTNPSYFEVGSIRIAPVASPALSRRSIAGCASSRS